jgi:hypothetical protein
LHQDFIYHQQTTPPPPLFSLAEEIQGAKILKNKKQNVQHFVSRLFIPLREKIYKKKKNETN